MRNICILAIASVFFVSCKKEKPEPAQPQITVQYIQAEAAKSYDLAHFVIKFKVTIQNSDGKFSNYATINREQKVEKGATVAVISDDADVESKASAVIIDANQTVASNGFYQLNQAETHTFMLHAYLHSLIPGKNYRVVISNIRVFIKDTYYDIETNDLQAPTISW